jgi:ribonuclease P/MRP protein subunit POP1
MADDRYESGARSAHVALYHDQTFPYGLIGPVEVIWNAEEQHLSERTIWIRLHPSIHEETMAIFEFLISLQGDGNGEASTSTAGRSSAVKLADLKDKIDSFEIMGPKSARILRRILRLSKTEGKDKAKVRPFVL